MKMNNVQHLLDTLGPPPAEVCLDWAWQLVSMLEGTRTRAHVNWSQLLIDDAGHLMLQESAEIASADDAEAKAMDELVQQLLYWSNNAAVQSGEIHSTHADMTGSLQSVDAMADSPAVVFSATALQEHRHALTRYILAMQSIAESSVSESSVSESSVSESSVSESSGAENSVDSGSAAKLAIDFGQKPQPAEDVQANSMISEASDEISLSGHVDAARGTRVGNSLRARKSRGSKSSRFPSKRLFAIGLVIAACLIGFMWPRGQRREAADKSVSETASQRPSTPSAAVASNKAGRKKSTAVVQEPLEEDTLELAPSTEVAPSTVVTSAADAVTNLEPSTAEKLLSGLAETVGGNVSGISLNDGLSSISSIASQAEPPVVGSSEKGINSPVSQSSESASASHNSSDQAVPAEDVTSMLAAALKTEPKISNIQAEAVDSGILRLSAQLLDIDSMLHVQEISAKVRVRQPVWQLRIASTDAFSVEPSGLQSLAEKETVQWVLTAKELKPIKDHEPTQIVVLAQLAGRRADIKWKVAAGCTDLPAILVPLNEEWLDTMLETLQIYQQRLATGVAKMKEALELPGVPREQKSLLSAQRKAMESEGKLVVRARQIIADAGMFVGWLDRSIQMHGRLTDQIAGQSVTILQIGQPDPPSANPSSDNPPSGNLSTDDPPPDDPSFENPPSDNAPKSSP